MGPWLVPIDEILPFDELRIQTHVTGEFRQDDSPRHEATSSSRSTTVDLLRAPARRCHLHRYTDRRRRLLDRRSAMPGDVVEVSVPVIGTLRNPSLPSSTARPTSSHREAGQRATHAPFRRRRWPRSPRGDHVMFAVTRRTHHRATVAGAPSAARRSADRGSVPANARRCSPRSPHRRPPRRRRHDRRDAVGDARRSTLSPPRDGTVTRIAAVQTTYAEIEVAFGADRWSPFSMSSTISPSCSTPSSYREARDPHHESEQIAAAAALSTRPNAHEPRYATSPVSTMTMDDAYAIQSAWSTSRSSAARKPSATRPAHLASDAGGDGDRHARLAFPHARVFELNTINDAVASPTWKSRSSWPSCSPPTSPAPTSPSTMYSTPPTGDPLDRTDRRPVVPGRCRDRTHPHCPRHHRRQRRRRIVCARPVGPRVRSSMDQARWEAHGVIERRPSLAGCSATRPPASSGWPLPRRAGSLARRGQTILAILHPPDRHRGRRYVSLRPRRPRPVRINSLSSDDHKRYHQSVARRHHRARRHQTWSPQRRHLADPYEIAIQLQADHLTFYHSSSTISSSPRWTRSIASPTTKPSPRPCAGPGLPLSAEAQDVLAGQTTTDRGDVNCPGPTTAASATSYAKGSATEDPDPRAVHPPPQQRADRHHDGGRFAG